MATSAFRAFVRTVGSALAKSATSDGTRAYRSCRRWRRQPLRWKGSWSVLSVSREKPGCKKTCNIIYGGQQVDELRLRLLFPGEHDRTAPFSNQGKPDGYPQSSHTYKRPFSALW